VFFFGACKSTVFSITGIVLFSAGYSDMQDPEKGSAHEENQPNGNIPEKPGYVDPAE